MIGIVRKLNREKTFGFIKSDKTDYFFHRDNFDGHWNDLVDDSNNFDVEVEFEPKRSEKGLRAEEVRRTDNG